MLKTFLINFAVYHNDPSYSIPQVDTQLSNLYLTVQATNPNTAQRMVEAQYGGKVYIYSVVLQD